MRSYAYIRKDYPVLTREQLDMLRIYDCQEVFIEENDFAVDSELERLLETLTVDDQLLVYNLRVFAKKSREFKELLTILRMRNIRLISLQDELDTEISVDFYTDVLKVLEMEEKHRSYTIRTSIELAKQQGSLIGRPRVDNQTIEQIIFLFEQKGKRMREIAEICNVSLGTVYKYVKRREPDH